MSRHNYAQIPVSEAHDDLNHSTPTSPQQLNTHLASQQQQQSAASRRSNGYTALHDNEANDDDDDDEHEHDEHDAFLGQSHPLSSSSGHRSQVDEISLAPSSSTLGTPASTSRASTPASSRRVIGSGNDGVFANLSAKPRVEKAATEELPPPYKQAALDATPAYYETTVNAPEFFDDDVLVEGLPVGNIYGFIWNFIVSMSFQFVGFFLTYLLHTSHSTKNGSKAGLGVTFITMGLQMMTGEGLSEDEDSDTGYMTRAGQTLRVMAEYIWLSYILIILGSFLLVRSIYDFARVKRTEMIINATSSRANNSSDGTITSTAGSVMARRGSSDDDPVVATLTFIDLEAGLATAHLNRNNLINSATSPASSSSTVSPNTTASVNEPSSTLTDGTARRDQVITLHA
ncbi:hypothetical protein BGW42_002525 [Actinomortierella wolfii]|nr:hypothetical protein BGW42_002525 [Actinomortierella wolfii]